jgi:hypothetical protein
MDTGVMASPTTDARTSATDDRPTRAVVVGECLIELLRTGADTVTTRPAGDTFNTASMLARASRPWARRSRSPTGRGSATIRSAGRSSPP